MINIYIILVILVVTAASVLYFTPRKFTYKKIHRKVGLSSAFGAPAVSQDARIFSVLVVSQDFGLFFGHHIEFLRRIIKRRAFERFDKLSCRFSMCKPITQKPLQARMGKGYGKLVSWVGFVRPGTVLFEIFSGKKVENEVIQLTSIFDNFFKKLPFPIKLIFTQKYLWFFKKKISPQTHVLYSSDVQFKKKTRKSYKRVKKMFRRRKKRKK